MLLGPNSKSWPNGDRFREILVLADLDFANNLNPQKSSKTMWFFKMTRKCALAKCLEFWRYWFKNLVLCSVNTFLEEIFFISSLTHFRRGIGPKLEKLTKRCSISWIPGFNWFGLCQQSKSSKIVKNYVIFQDDPEVRTRKVSWVLKILFWKFSLVFFKPFSRGHIFYFIINLFHKCYWAQTRKADQMVLDFVKSWF